MRRKKQQKKRTKGTLIIVWQALRLHQGGAEHPAERSASVVWLLCILLRLHSECQAPLNRTGSRSSWRQEQTPAGTEAGSHWGLAGLLHAERRPLPSAHSSVRPTGARQRRASEGLDGCGCETLWKWSVHLLWGRSLSLSPRWRAIFQDFALGMFSSCGRGDWVHLLYTASSRNIKLAEGNVWRIPAFFFFPFVFLSLSWAFLPFQSRKVTHPLCCLICFYPSSQLCCYSWLS